MPARTLPFALLAFGLAIGCGEGDDAARAPVPAPAEAAARVAPPQPPAAAADLPRGLLVAISVFERGESGPLPKSQLLVLRRQDGRWQAQAFEDPASNVFHKALVYAPPGEAPGILTLGGTAAALKLWRAGPAGFAPAATLWEADFGGRFSRMRDAEVADLDGDGVDEIAVATHDQGVVAVVDPGEAGFAVRELDREPGKFVHEIEVGDLDGDGALEIYATPSDPNKLDGRAQHGEVVRYAASGEPGRTPVADLGSRHAKEILVADVDGDGTDELYVSVEAVEGGDLEVRRYEAGTEPGAGVVIASLPDPMCRFLTVGDVDGDGRLELVAAAKDSGLWLLRPVPDPRARWQVAPIDADSHGFEHAALLADLDGDGLDELYVASDEDREIRRYVWTGDGFARETIHRHAGELPLLTWNLTAAPLEVLP